MKAFLKVVAIGTAATLAVAMTPTEARAGHDDGWKAGAIIAGVATVGLIAALNNHHDRGYREHYAPPPPPPCAPAQRWIDGHYDCGQERVCVPGYWNTVCEPAQYGWVRQGYRNVYVQIRPEIRRQVWVPERYEYRETRVWVPAHWEVAAYARAY